MMSAALHTIAANSSRAAVIWLLLVLLSLAALVGLALPHGVRRPRQISAWLTESARHQRLAEERKAAEAAEQIRYAEEITVAAQRAAATAERHREECQLAQAGVDAAWQAYQDADEALTRARRAAAFTTSDGGLDAADREQALRRLAQAAYRRGDLSNDQLLDALTHRNGWEAGLHPIEQELKLARAAVQHRFGAYQRALEVEQDAWRAADIATASVNSLRREVTVAVTLADAARSALAPGERTGQRRHRVAAAA
jgi:guanyl-specific ribonuclease Sa